MSVEVSPVGIHCKRACVYCYELPGRQLSRNARPPAVDHAAVQATVKTLVGKRGHFSLHGGEPMLAPDEDLEALFAFGLKQYGRNGVQTDGACLTERHFAMFRRYRVHVGFSIDGPGELNDARVAGTLAQTRAATARSEAALRRCLREGISCGVISTLHRANASPDRLPRLLAWFGDLSRAGLRSARLHALEMDGGARLFALPVEQAVAAFVAADELERALARRPWWRLRRRPSLRFTVFKDIDALLRADDDGVSCIWTACDPWTTPAVKGVAPDGARTLCQRVAKDGAPRPPAPPGPLVRQLVLASTPQEQGGCQGCRFLIACKGQCPGTAIDHDWRKRSADCALWFALLERAEGQLEARGIVPVSRRPDLPDIEGRMRRAWARGINATIKGCVTNRYQAVRIGDVCHQDHDDHTDVGPALEGAAGGERVND